MPNYSKPIHIIAAKRSPIGRFGGSLRAVEAVDLATQVAAAVVAPSLAPQVDAVIFGQVLQAAVGMNAARQVGLRLGIRQSAPAYTVNMVCGSGLKAVAIAADAIEQDEATVKKKPRSGVWFMARPLHNHLQRALSPRLACHG